MDADIVEQHVDETAVFDFNGATYDIRILCDGSTLTVEAEQRDDATVWKAQFGSKYIEDITQRTHSFKPFRIFVRMLVTALRKVSDSVFVDLLTYADLELLKTKRTGQQTGSQGTSNKRYLILTYAAEFDRVHYPLPLQMEEPDPQRLKFIIGQLRQKLDAQSKKSNCLRRVERQQSENAPEVRALLDEIAALKRKIASLDCSKYGPVSDMQQLTAEAQETVQDVRQIRKERDALLCRAQQAEASLEGERNLHRREIRRRMKEHHDISSELSAAKEQIRELRLKCRELTQELDLAQRRAKVANLSASYLERTRQSGPRPLGRSAVATPLTSRRASPAGSRLSSRDNSPAAACRGIAGVNAAKRSRSTGPERPSSAPCFDPTEYIRQRRDKQQAAAQRLEEVRRHQRIQHSSSRPTSRPSSRPRSLPDSRHSSLPSSRHSTPVRSKISSRDSSVDRGYIQRDQRVGRHHDSSALSTDRIGRNPHAVCVTTRRDDRATSPGRALLEVKEKLSRIASRSSTLDQVQSKTQTASSLRLTDAQSGHENRIVHEVNTGDSLIDATTEIADIDARLQSLQQFLKAAKAGIPSQVPP